MKVCAKCKQERHDNMFGRAPRNSDGLQSWCRECYRRARNAYGIPSESELAALSIDELLKKPLYLRSLGLAQRGLKFCKRCNEVKNRSDFSPMGPKKPKKLAGYCKQCHSERLKKERLINPDIQKRQNISRRHKRATNPEHAERVRKYWREYVKSPRMRLMGRLRSHTKILKDKPESTSTLLGGKAKDIIAHLTNGGSVIPAGYDVDHHVPIAFFNLENDFQRLACFNWRNLRLLPVSVNRAKRDVLPENHEQHLIEICQVLGFPKEEVLCGRNKKIPIC